MSALITCVLYGPIALSFALSLFAFVKQKLNRSIFWTVAILCITVFEVLESNSFFFDIPILFPILKFFQIMMLVAQLIQVSEDRPGLNNSPKPY